MTPLKNRVIKNLGLQVLHFSYSSFKQWDNAIPRLFSLETSGEAVHVATATTPPRPFASRPPWALPSSQPQPQYAEKELGVKINMETKI